MKKSTVTASQNQPGPDHAQPVPADKTKLQHAPNHPKVQNIAEAAVISNASHFASDHGVLSEQEMGFGGYLWIGICFVTSYLFCIFGLTWLLACAVFSVSKKVFAQATK